MVDVTSTPVTGGELFKLWEVGHKYMAQAEAFYEGFVKSHNDTISGGDEATFGPCIAAWKGLQEEVAFLMVRTEMSLEMTRLALDQAVINYQYVDGDNAKALTTAGEELQNYIDKEKSFNGDGSTV